MRFMRDGITQLTFVFDLDNTLVETDIANSLAYMDAIALVLGTSISWDLSCRFTRDSLSSMFPELSDELRNKVIKAKNGSFRAHIGETTVNTNLVKILDGLHRSGNRTILLTNSHRARAIDVCDYYGITELFSEKYFAEDKVSGSKYEILVRNGYDLGTVVLFENEAEEARTAAASGIAMSNIIEVKY